VSGLVRRVANERYRWSEAIRRSAVVRGRGRFVWREIRRRPGTARYPLRGSGQPVHVRHDTGDVAGLREIFLNGNYDPPPRVAAALERLARQRPLRIADLGANIGLFGLSVYARFDAARVVAFEPDADNARVLELTRRASAHAADWELVAACVGASARRVAFRGGLHMESRVAEDGDPDAEQVQMIDVLPRLQGIDWLKMDVEGGEWEILADPRFAALEIPVIALEYHPFGCPAADARAEVVRLLGSAGYEIEPYVERSPGLGELWALRR
jgi:FkbM family methyltransferase